MSWQAEELKERRTAQGAQTPSYECICAGALCAVGWHTALHSCHCVLAGFLFPTQLSCYLQCSSQTPPKCYDSIYPVKLGSDEKTKVIAIPTKARKDIISLIITAVSALFSLNSLIHELCWQATASNYTCPQDWEWLVARRILCNHCDLDIMLKWGFITPKLSV